MGKDPAVLFYPADFIVGCIGMSDAQIGQYIQLLCIQHQKGHLGEAIILKICGTLDEDVLSKFSKDSEGKYFNERMDEEKQKRKKHSAQQSLNAKKRWDKKPSEGCDGNATAMPLESENENESESKVESEKKVKEPAWKKFYRDEWEKAKGHKLATKYQHLVKYMMNLDPNIIGEPGLHILELKKQLSFSQFVELYAYCEKRSTTIKEMVDSWLNTPGYSKGKVSVYANLQTWARKVPIQGTNFQDNKKPLIQTKIGKR